MEIACVMEGRLAAPVRSGRPGGARPGRDLFARSGRGGGAGAGAGGIGTAVEERAPERSQQVTLRALGDRRPQEIVASYMEAMGRGDVGQVVSMLAADAAWSMPPLASWYGGPRGGIAEVEEFQQVGPLSGEWRWKHLATSANAQPAIGVYSWDEEQQTHLPFALDVLTLEGDRIKEVTAFIVRTTELPEASFRRWPAQEAEPDQVRSVFERFALPIRLD